MDMDLDMDVDMDLDVDGRIECRIVVKDRAPGQTASSSICTGPTPTCTD
jgi:hypothetical protein